MLGHFDQGDLRLRFTFEDVVIFAEFEQGRHPGFQLDFRGPVLVFSQSLDDVTQAQPFDDPQVHLPGAVIVEFDEMQQVGGRDVGDAGQNLVGGKGGGCHAGLDRGPDCTFLYQSRPLRFRASIPRPPRGTGGRTLRFTQVVVDELSLSKVEWSHFGIPLMWNRAGC